MKIKRGLKKEWDKAVKNNSKDGYSLAVVKATESVGEALDEGKTIQEAHDAMHGHDLTGFMAGCVASWIARFHPRGEEFRVWWNKDTQIKDEGDKANVSGGILNPALMTMAVKK